MEYNLKWGFSEWCRVPMFFSKTNKKYYWDKCKIHLSSKHIIEALGDVSQIKEYYTIIEQMLNNILDFAVENHLESELEMILTESKSFSHDLQLLNSELNNIIERKEIFKLKELEDKTSALKSSIEQNNFYFEYLYLKEIFLIRHKVDSHSAFRSAVEAKAEGIAEKKWLKLKDEFVKVLDLAEQNYKSKTDAIILAANVKFDSMKFELEQKLDAQLNKYKTDTEKLQKDILTLKTQTDSAIFKLTNENKILKTEWENAKSKLVANQESRL